VEKGYGGTTIAEIARAAGVATETVYATFQSKSNLLHRTWDVAVGGDEQDVHLLDRPEMRAVFDEPDLAVRLRRFAGANTTVMRRTAKLRRAVQGAAGTDAAVADLEATIDDARLESFSVHARRAAATGQLAVPEDECRDVLFATTDGSLWITLVARRGWSDARYAEWLGGLWVGLLVANSGDPSGRASR
jgi:AcrR family transcriptional regulator